MRLSGWSEDELGRRAAGLAAAVRRAWRGIARAVAAKIQTAHVVTHATADAAVAAWQAAVDEQLLGHVQDTYLDAAGHVLVSLELDDDLLIGEDLVKAHIHGARNRLRRIGDDVWKITREQIALGLREGESVQRIAARVRNVTGVSDARSLVIARTETHAAYESASYEQARFVDPDATKRWLATADSRTRETHRAADGQEVKISEPFQVGAATLRYPGDPLGDPSETISCRCSVAYEFGGKISPVSDGATSDDQLTVVAAAGGKWKPSQHPRGKDGKFIKKGAVHDLLVKKSPTIDHLIDAVTELDQQSWNKLTTEQKQYIQDKAGVLGGPVKNKIDVLAANGAVVEVPSATVAHKGAAPGSPAKITTALVWGKHTPGTVIVEGEGAYERIVWNGKKYEFQTNGPGDYITVNTYSKKDLYENFKNAPGWLVPGGGGGGLTEEKKPTGWEGTPEAELQKQWEKGLLTTAEFEQITGKPPNIEVETKPSVELLTGQVTLKEASNYVHAKHSPGTAIALSQDGQRRIRADLNGHYRLDLLHPGKGEWVDHGELGKIEVIKRIRSDEWGVPADLWQKVTGKKPSGDNNVEPDWVDELTGTEPGLDPLSDFTTMQQSAWHAFESGMQEASDPKEMWEALQIAKAQLPAGTTDAETAEIMDAVAQVAYAGEESNMEPDFYQQMFAQMASPTSDGIGAPDQAELDEAPELLFGQQTLQDAKIYVHDTTHADGTVVAVSADGAERIVAQETEFTRYVLERNVDGQWETTKSLGDIATIKHVRAEDWGVPKKLWESVVPQFTPNQVGDNGEPVPGTSKWDTYAEEQKQAFSAFGTHVAGSEDPAEVLAGVQFAKKLLPPGTTDAEAVALFDEMGNVAYGAGASPHFYAELVKPLIVPDTKISYASEDVISNWPGLLTKKFEPGDVVALHTGGKYRVTSSGGESARIESLGVDGQWALIEVVPDKNDLAFILGKFYPDGLWVVPPKKPSATASDLDEPPAEAATPIPLDENVVIGLGLSVAPKQSGLTFAVGRDKVSGQIYRLRQHISNEVGEITVEVQLKNNAGTWTSFGTYDNSIDFLENWGGGVTWYPATDDSVDAAAASGAQLPAAEVSVDPGDISGINTIHKNIFKNEMKKAGVGYWSKPNKIWDAVKAIQKQFPKPDQSGHSQYTPLQILKALDVQLKTQEPSPYVTKMTKWAASPKGQAHIAADEAPGVAPPTPDVPEPAAPKKPKVVPTSPTSTPAAGQLNMGGGDISHLTEDAKQNLYATFKKQPSTYLDSPPTDVYAAMKTIADDRGVTLLQMLRVIDDVGAKKVDKPDEHLFEKKIKDWLKTPQGAAVASGKPIPLPDRPKFTPGVDPDKQLPTLTAGNALKYEVVSVQKTHEIWQESVAKYGDWTGSQSKALKTYTGGSYYSINAFLYGKLDAVSPTHATSTKNAQAGMRPSTRPLLLHRGVNYNGIANAKNHADLEKAVGQTWKSGGFFSTSVGGHAAFGGHPVLIEVEAPPGTPMAWVRPISHYPSENEMLLAAGLSYRIVSVKQSGYKSVVRVRVVPEEPTI